MRLFKYEVCWTLVCNLRFLNMGNGHDRYFWKGHSKYGCFANEYAGVFTIDGMKFQNVSWYMWFRRAQHCDRRGNLAGLIREASSVEEAKQLSRRCSNRGARSVLEWKSARLTMMGKAVLRKFECNTDIAQILIDTGEDRLIYASGYDGFYGIGMTMQDGWQREDEWGQNYLGKILMVVRKRLKERGLRFVRNFNGKR